MPRRFLPRPKASRACLICVGLAGNAERRNKLGARGARPLAKGNVADDNDSVGTLAAGYTADAGARSASAAAAAVPTAVGTGRGRYVTCVVACTTAATTALTMRAIQIGSIRTWIGSAGWYRRSLTANSRAARSRAPCARVIICCRRTARRSAAGSAATRSRGAAQACRPADSTDAVRTTRAAAAATTPG